MITKYKSNRKLYNKIYLFITVVINTVHDDNKNYNNN